MPDKANEAARQTPVASADPHWLSATVVCPACLTSGVLRNARSYDGATFCECSGCHRLYSIDGHGVVDFQPPDKLLALPAGVLEMWSLAQRRAMDEYRSRSPGSVAAPERGAARAFGRFIDVAGKTVLDVGSGSDYFPAYMQGQSSAQYVAMDPLPVEQAVPFTKLQAWAELMPFADASFDVLLCGTSLDHVVDLESALGEMARVLRPGGVLYLWTALYVDPKWFANLLAAPCFVRHKDEVPRSFETYRRERERLKERLGSEEIEQTYGHLLVDRWHFRHLPVSFVKQFGDYGFALRQLEVWEHNFHEGAIFLNAFVALENQGDHDERASQVDRQLGVWAMLAGLTERMVHERQEIGVIREVVASGHRHTEMARQELQSLTATLEGASTRDETESAAARAALQEQIGRHGRALEELAALADRVEALREQQASLAAALDRLAGEQARIAPAVAAMNDQLQHIGRAHRLARLLAWMRGKQS
jgi:SAM-dependent methyltransferase